MDNRHELFAEMNRLVDAAGRENIHLRVIGGLAVHFHSPLRQHEISREYADIDFVVNKRERRKLENFFKQMGYESDRTFNLLNNDRKIFAHAGTGHKIDIFVGDFVMCHKLPMRNRLSAHPVTIPLAELFLSKTQIIELNRKDALDLIALLRDNEPGFDDDTINLNRIMRLCAHDWGLYKTTSINLARLEAILYEEPPVLSKIDTETVFQRISQIRRALHLMPTSLLWKARDRVGTRLRWYAEVEEVDL